LRSCKASQKTPTGPTASDSRHEARRYDGRHYKFSEDVLQPYCVPRSPFAGLQHLELDGWPTREIECERAKRFEVPADLPVPRDREVLAQVLASFGTRLVREVNDPTVIAVFRLAIAEVVQAPEVARALDSIGREAGRAALRKIMAGAQASGLLSGRPGELAEQFAGLLWRDLMVSLLLGVTERPSSREIGERARSAAATFLQLHPRPSDTP
jgi:hypothetical protein